MSTSKSNLKSWTFTDTGVSTLTGGVPFLDSHSRSASALDSVTYGDNIKDWRRKIAMNQSATTTLDGVHYKVKASGGGMETKFYSTAGALLRTIVNDGQILSDLYHRFGVPSFVISNVAEQKAASKFLSHYIEAQNTFRGGNFLAEVLETIHMVAHPVRSLYRSVWTHAGNIGKLRNVYKHTPDLLKHMSDAWLAWAFGVKPLLSDCDDAASAFNKLREGFRSDSIPISGFGRESTVVNLRKGGQGSPIVGGSYVFDDITINHNTVRYRGVISARPEDTAMLIRQFGVGLYDVLPAIWEGTPWSFFVDYFANVQECLDSMRLWNAEMSWLNRTIRNSVTVNLTSPNGSVTPTVKTYMYGGRHYTLKTYVSRGPSAIPYPGFHFKMPGFPSLKWLNIAALAKQVQFARTGKRQ